MSGEANSLRVAIAGAGPAGAALAFLLARRGIAVTLVERQSDFAREFRGEGLMPGGVEALAQMGLGAELESLPQARIRDLDVYLNGRHRLHIDASALPAGTPLPRFVSQPALLEMLVAQAGKHAGFELLRGATVRDVTQAAGRVVGLRVDGPAGPRELAADFVIACDGRASLVRKRVGLERRRDAQAFDVVWCKFPLPEFMRARVRGCVGRGHFAIVFEAPDGLLQLGWAIEKGSYGDIRHGGVEHWIEQLAQNLPADLAAWIRAHAAEVTHPFLLDVVCDHLDVWSAPGVLLLGDAAHPMSPVGAQGINIALRDAVVAANHLGPPLLRGASADELDRAARAIVSERLPEVKEIQTLQRNAPRVLFQRTLGARLLMATVVPLALRTGLAALALRSVFPRFARGTTRVSLEF
ncbi:MAG TPA: FAD-dependent monooxygenase [Myxococcota bacterium]|nr:FAD-dependent monooxygenase [Myxococcota bacterium]